MRQIGSDHRIDQRDLVVTELASDRFRDDRAILLETGSGISVAQVVAATDAELTMPNNIPEMSL